MKRLAVYLGVLWLSGVRVNPAVCQTPAAQQGQAAQAAHAEHVDGGAVYLAAGGSDANPCTRARPCATLDHGMELVEVEGRGALWLRAGDVFHGTVRIRAGNVVVGSYGEANGGRAVIVAEGELPAVSMIGDFINNVVVRDLELRTEGYTGWPKRSAVSIVSCGSGLLLEDLYVPGWANGAVVHGWPLVRLNVVVRRCTFDGPWTSNVNDGGTGLFIAECPGVIIAECSALGETDPGRYTSHGYYVNSFALARFNLATECGRSNFSFRAGGEIDGCLSYRGAQGVCIGLATNPAVSTASVTGSVIIETRDYQNGQGLGRGITLDMADALVTGNLIAEETDGTDPVGIVAGPATWGTISGNRIHNWTPAVVAHHESAMSVWGNEATAGAAMQPGGWWWIESWAASRPVGAPTLIPQQVRWELERHRP
jgi:hypothetical protein